MGWPQVERCKIMLRVLMVRQESMFVAQILASYELNEVCSVDLLSK
jgi:hypothetical protein